MIINQDWIKWLMKSLDKIRDKNGFTMAFIGFIKASSNCSGHESRSLRTGRTVDTVKAAWITSAGILEKMEFDAYGR